jgi:hypothetical protein
VIEFDHPFNTSQPPFTPVAMPRMVNFDYRLYTP